jgi:uncharacterized protein (TIRG00374 family)
MTKLPSTKHDSKQNLRSKIILGAKITFVCSLLYFLAKKGFISVHATQQALQQWQKIVPAVLALFVSALLGVYRWQWLLRAHQIDMKWSKIFQLTFIGNFFNIALPGAVSGDFVKAFYIGREAKGQRAKAFGSILFDRVAGLSALVLVSAGALAFGIGSYLHTPLIKGIQLLLGVGAVCVISFYAYLFCVREHHDPILRILNHLEKSVPKIASVVRIYESLRHYHSHKLTVLKVLAISVIIHLIYGWGCLNFAEALGDLNLSLTSVYIVVPLGLLITAVPVAPAGIGTGNVAFLYFFQLIHSDRGGDVFSLVALTNILIGFLGGLIYFRYRGLEQLPSSEDKAFGSMPVST